MGGNSLTPLTVTMFEIVVDETFHATQTLSFWEPFAVVNAENAHALVIS